MVVIISILGQAVCNTEPIRDTSTKVSKTFWGNKLNLKNDNLLEVPLVSFADSFLRKI